MKNASNQSSEKRAALMVLEKFDSMNNMLGLPTSNDDSSSFADRMEVYNVSILITDPKGVLLALKNLFPFLISKQNFVASSFAFIPVEEKYQDWIASLTEFKEYPDRKKLADIMTPFYEAFRVSLFDLVEFAAHIDGSKLIYLIMAIEEYQVLFKETHYIQLIYLCQDLMKHCQELFDNFIVSQTEAHLSR
jgi:hypothetical protein